MSMSAPAWRVPVRLEEVPAAGQRFALEAEAATRNGLAAAAGLAGLPRLAATFEVARHGRDGLHVTGTVSATVQQTCVVTLEPMESEIEEAIDLTFVPAAGRERSGVAQGASPATAGDDDLETLVNGAVDLGALATEFLLLGIDPYPRKPDAEFASPPAKDAAGHPFAALAALKKGGG
jgi:uncharacterized metal-binding protein YceD (DUF177 family)